MLAIGYLILYWLQWFGRQQSEWYVRKDFILDVIGFCSFGIVKNLSAQIQCPNHCNQYSSNKNTIDSDVYRYDVRHKKRCYNDIMRVL